MFWCAVILATLISGCTGSTGLEATGVRLVDGSGPYEGRVEVRVNGIWGTICDRLFDANAGKVLCRMMNMTYTAFFPDAKYGEGTGPIFADSFVCSGSETHIEQCSYQPATTCFHRNDVSLVCSKCGELSIGYGVIDSMSADGTTLSLTCNSSKTTAICDSSGHWSPSSIWCKPDNPFDISSIRLTNGVGLYDGRVEVMVNGTWGDICYNSFSSIDATAICNILFGLPYYQYDLYNSYDYGYGSTTHIDLLACTGNETDINNCPFDKAGYCYTRYKVAVACDSTPQNITDIRLANGSVPYDGRVELKSGNSWGTICDSTFNTNDGNVLCGMMNLSLTTFYKNGKYGPGVHPVRIGQVYCPYSYLNNIHECTFYPPYRQYCSSSNGALSLVCTDCGNPKIQNGAITSSNGMIMTVTCNTGYVPSTYTIECLSNGTWLQNEICEVYGYPLNITDMRLANGVGLYDGRVEVKVNGTWGTICHSSIVPITETRAICNIMFDTQNYRAYVASDLHSYYGQGTGPIYIDNLDCDGSETDINQCKYNVLNSCTHSNDLIVVCNVAPLNITDIRLVNGTDQHNGIVELLTDGVWGTICKYNFDLNEANTLCNMMNLSLWSFYTTPVFGDSSSPVLVEFESCSGSYEHINQCSYQSPSKGYNGYCKKNGVVSLACTDNRLNITDLRLVPGPYHGRVEINVNDTWGTVCDNSFSNADGQVICRMLGLSSRSAYGGAYYGQGTGPVHIDKLTCSGNEPDINECSYIYDNTCGHNKDSSVLCYGPDLNITEVRLADGTGPYDGRVEIKVNDTWGTICDRDFDINDADAFCQMLGTRAAQYFTGARYGEDSGPVYIDQLYCNPWATDLNNCQYLYTNSCTHERDASVVCNECGQPDISYWDIGYFSFKGSTLFADCAYYRTYIGTLSMTCNNETKEWTTEGECQEYRFPLDITDIRLADGNSSSNGRVEIKSMDTWGTICHDSFGMNEAHTICNMLGIWPAVAYSTNSAYGAGTGPIFVDDLQCGINVSHINDCRYVTYDDCTHDQDISVVCLDCGDPTPPNGMINSTKTNFGTVVEVSCEAGYRLIGNDTITCEMNGHWSDRPFCQLIDCGSPKPENGNVNSTSTGNGTVVMVTCDTGYNISGDSVISCQEDDKWTDYPTCEILDCGHPTPENADVELKSNATTYGDYAVISCKHGYHPDGSKSVMCLETGQWDTMPMCKIVDCGDPTPNKGSRNDTTTTYGTVVEITCDVGLDIKGNSTIVCQADGTWSDNPVCDANDCGRPIVSNGQVDDSNGTAAGSIVTITCNQGYDLTGSAAVICLSGIWNDTVMECVKQDCGNITLENGHIVSIDGTMYGDTVTLKCNDGFKIEGDSTITCEDGGRWSSEPVCIIRDCGPLQSLDNGHMEISGTVFNSTASFSCDSGYLLEGEASLICQNDGAWSNGVPKCVKLGNIGDHCESDRYCKADGAICKQSTCTCITGVYDNTTDKCDTMYMYQFGTSAGDKMVGDWERCANGVKFSAGLPLFGTTHIRLFVCSHGLVSFNRRYNNPTPPNNIAQVNKLKRDVIAPFHAHFNSTSGAVYYRSYDVLDSYENLTSRPEVRDIEKRVRQFGTDTSFKASFVLIATWNNVLPADKDLDQDLSEPSTFQLVLASNGEQTYSMNIYPNGKMKWISNRRNFAPVWVGHFGKEDTAFAQQHSFTPNVLALDTTTKHSGVSGVVFRSLVDIEKTTQNPNISCITWYQENKHEKQLIDQMNSWLPQCPCDISLARWDPWFWHIDRWNWYNKKNFTCVDMFPGRTFRPYGKSCCYDYRTSLWVDERPIAGGFHRYHPEHAADHYKHDVVPKDMCCSPLTPFCKFYYDLRPIGSCYRESPYDFGSYWGDPHFNTLDGLNFTFNGLGEYTLLEINTENTTFSLQARTERAIKKDGNISDATVFSAFAAKDETNASIHVELNRAKQGFNIYGNGFDLTNQYIQKTSNDTPLLNVPGGTLFVSKRGETLSVLFPSSGISLNISVSVEMLSLSTIVPKKFNNVTRGLLGNYNGKPDDDFMLPNGTILDADITERTIFTYGKTWEIDGDNSAFVYPDGKNHSDFHNGTYIPRFLDEVDPDKRQEAEKACNGTENIECVFDYVFTENKDVALATTMLKGNADKTKNQMDEVIPSLIGCDQVNVTINSSVSCPVTIEDNITVDFTANSVNAKFDQDTKAITFMQQNDSPVDIRVVAKNPNGRSSPVFIVVVLLCTGCNGHGICTNVPRDDVRNTEYFQYATCECQPQYEGPDCENVYDGCSDAPCSLGRECTSLTASKQEELNRTYICDACPTGYMSPDKFNDSCLDINECDSHPCEHECTNTDGSFECMCKTGYRTNPRDVYRCTDINECEDLNTPHNCEQNCTNTEGSFTCSCFKGYNLMSNGSCAQDQTHEDKCAHMNCSRNGGCKINEEGTAECFCNSGYELDSDNVCKDINECDRNACPQNCNNTIGGFECSCFSGYQLEGRTTCKECDVGFWGDNCANKCECSGEGVAYCDRVKGCICEAGWQGETCDVDINECNATVDICNDSCKYCQNNQGSYFCKCMDGFYETSNGKCGDVDECSNPSLNNCDQICKNTVGSYSCQCETGFKATSERECENIDECTLQAHGCEQVCNDNPGSYNCFCYFGYSLNDDRKTCTKLSDPCLTIYGMNCSHYCFIKTDDAECRCQDGFQLGTDQQTCTDIDECKSEDHQCDYNAECRNTEGSYTCECPVGFKLENDGRTCTACDDYYYGLNCASTCNCLHGNCNSTTGCICDSGWRGNSCDVDLNECEVGTEKCSNPNEECINTPGSFVCNCLKGYSRYLNGDCNDVDECSDVRLNSCDQRCMNTPGGYICECQNGFLFTDGKCRDINECENGKSNCGQLCENTLGSYRCYCEEGFKLNQTDRLSCHPAAECSSNICGENATCFNNNGVNNCHCLNGFQNVSGKCEDVNECETMKPCSQGCNNTVGGYDCSCDRGYYLAEDHTTCKVCEKNTYGHECRQNCSCDPQNTQSCDPIKGVCSCKIGWKGVNCTKDIDECSNSTICSQHSKCENTDGSYNCKCNVGYFKLPSGSCSECDDIHYGVNCDDQCKCNVPNTVSCDKVTGSCECKKGWKGDTCSEDINECDTMPDVCTNNEHSTCNNIIGSFKCLCKDGFTEIDNKCVDVNECIGNNSCTQDCVNNMGGYTCQCSRGYHGYWNTCTECSNNAYGENCTESCKCKKDNTVHVDNLQTCNRATGECKCLPNWKGEHCDQDVDECKDVYKCIDKPNSGCVNTFGWYQCQCYRGYTEVDSKCVPVPEITTQPPKDTAMRIDFQLTIQIPLTATTDLQIPSVYNEYEKLAEQSLMDYYKKFTSANIVIKITGLSKGSMKVNYTVMYKENDAKVASALLEAATTLNKEDTKLTFDDTDYDVTITSETVDLNANPCDTMYALKTCDLDKCELTNGVAHCKTESNSKLNLPEIIGISVGSGMLVLIIAVLVIVCVKRTRKRKHTTKERSLPDIPYRHKDNDDVKQWQDNQAGRNDGRYLTWKTMLTHNASGSQEENVYDEPYKIPRARARQQSNPSNAYMYF